MSEVPLYVNVEFSGFGFKVWGARCEVKGWGSGGRSHSYAYL